MKIAIIGAGISGLTAAYALNKNHDIKVFEKASSIGGHTATKEVETASGQYAIDTGFIVYNDWTYPTFIKLLDNLNIETQATTMGFSVSAHNKSYEYSGENLATLFAQPKNILSFKHWAMIRDILRFNKESIHDLSEGRLDKSMTLGQYLNANQYSQQFVDYYLVPMGCAIWSASTQDMLNFPLLFFVRFFKNHGLLSVNDRPTWRVIKGGSRAYLPKLTASFHERINTDVSIRSVERTDQSVIINIEGREPEIFDQVIFACHSDQALALLQQPTQDEQTILAAIRYQDNAVVLHTDTALLPKRKATWSSWNYLLHSTEQSFATLTYDMNILQGINAPETFCVTLNASDKIDPEKILGEYTYAHPVFSLDAIAAQESRHRINGVNRTWFCGAYWRNGFHEDGCLSGLQVAEALGGGL
ncbi:MAG: FAD-dependent oxidoreductase [Cellvibrionales bacterium]|nr:FAD-dependent oxidoreductase [Cellvibrionales bacterium]